MSDTQGFEPRLAAAYVRWASEVPTDVDALALVRATRGRTTRAPWAWNVARPVAATLLLGLLLTAVIAIIVLVGSRPQRPSMTYEGTFTETEWTTPGLRNIESFWGPTARHAAALLGDGRVLVVGLRVGDVSHDLTGSILDPVTGGSQATGPMRRVRGSPIATTLDEGRVLIVGGLDDDGVAVTSAELYDPTTDRYLEVAASGVDALAAARLVDGRVLLVGRTAAHLYDPGSEGLVPVGPMSRTAGARSASLLEDGRVLVVSAPPLGDSRWAELFDPVKRSFALTRDDPSSGLDVASGVRLDDGSVLFVGGNELAGGCPPDQAIASAEIFERRAESFMEVGPMSTARMGATTTLLAGGQVLVTGGLASPRSKCGATPQFLPDAETYDPSTRTLELTGPMAFSRAGHAAIALVDGQVLVIGGGGEAPAEIFQ